MSFFKIAHLLAFILFLQKANALNSTSRLGIPFSISYYGNSIVHPGFKMSADFIWFEFLKSKVQKNGNVKSSKKTLITTPYFSFYHHARSHQGFQLGTDILWRRTNGKGWFREFGLGLGYLNRQNLGDTWDVKNGVVQNLKGAYRGYFIQSFSLSKGKHILRKSGGHVIPFLRFNTDFINNYNSSVIPILSLEVGIRLIPSFSPLRRYRVIEKIKKND